MQSMKSSQHGAGGSVHVHLASCDPDRDRSPSEVERFFDSGGVDGHRKGRQTLRATETWGVGGGGGEGGSHRSTNIQKLSWCLILTMSLLCDGKY